MSRHEVVLLADDEPLSREFLQEALSSFGLEVHAVADGQQAIDALQERDYDLIVTDLRMPRADGMQVMAAAKKAAPGRPVVLVTAHGTMHVAVEAMRSGADDILEKPVVLDELEIVLARVRERSRLRRENDYLRAETVGGDLVVAAPSMQRVLDLVKKVAPSKATVMVRGESGTGKERVATMVHRYSDRATGPFVKLNCAAIPEALLESELFGHEAGAFTGAARRREGRFELADGGTLFLDEVGEMSAAMQSKLLRVLQEGEFERVGGTRTVKVDVRIVAATNRDLASAVENGLFRADLLYRLEVVPVQLPPLRERVEEIVPLARHFLRPGVTLDESAERELQAWSWPGNVRELQNVVERVGLLCEGGVVSGDFVRRWLRPMDEDVVVEPTYVLPSVDPIGALVGRPLADIERELVLRTLESCGGNRRRTAETLGIGVRTLFNKLQESAAEPSRA
ncbi:MAG: sigma-54-dependent Fis family transcriptional regulator [Planctomycetes bacterium]|nr:sigma-54-dependent Fis family transcriptional regulator [Planctomycetota bacterium]MCB9884172.1 sigma-54-dependent Fis family transcriptional regulator [Planctomycetota bacterium]